MTGCRIGTLFNCNYIVCAVTNRVKKIDDSFFMIYHLGLKVRSRLLSEDTTENEISLCSGNSECGTSQGL